MGGLAHVTFVRDLEIYEFLLEEMTYETLN